MRVAGGPIEIAIAYTLKESLLLLLKSIPRSSGLDPGSVRLGGAENAGQDAG